MQDAAVQASGDQAISVADDDPANLIGRTPSYMSIQITGLWVNAPNDVWAVAEGRRWGMALRWNGTTWSHVPNTENAMSAISGIWGSGAEDIWMVGSERSRLGDPISHWNGTVIAPAGSGIETSLEAVWGSGANDVWAVGHARAMAHWDGESWSSVTSPVEGDLADVWGNAPNRFFAVGCEGSLDRDDCRAGFVLRWDGSTWTEIRRGPETRYDHVWGSGDDLWVVGYHWISGRGSIVKVLRFDGSSWTYLEFPNEGERTDITGIGGSSSSDLWFGGHYTSTDGNTQNFVYRYNGEAIRREPSAESDYPSTFWPIGPSDVWIGSHESVARWNDGIWSSSVVVGLQDGGDDWVPMLQQDTPAEAGP